MRSHLLVVALAVSAMSGCRPANVGWTPASDAQVRSTSRQDWAVADDGVRLFYQVYGTRGDTLIYVHGGPGGNAGRQIVNLLPLAERHVVVAYDQRAGNGQSDIGDTLALGIERYVADLETIRRAVGAERVALFGHSWGTAVALRYADTHPERVRRLILNGPMPPARTPYDAQRTDSVRARIAARCRAQVHAARGPAAERQAAEERCRGRRDALTWIYFADTTHMARDRGAADRRPLNPVGLRATLRALGDWDFRPVMARVRVPALVIEGAESAVPLEHPRIWAQTMPEARLLLIPGAGHGYPYLEKPERFFPAVEEFLAGRWPPGARTLRVP